MHGNRPGIAWSCNNTHHSRNSKSSTEGRTAALKPRNHASISQNLGRGALMQLENIISTRQFSVCRSYDTQIHCWGENFITICLGSRRLVSVGGVGDICVTHTHATFWKLILTGHDEPRIVSWWTDWSWGRSVMAALMQTDAASSLSFRERVPQSLLCVGYFSSGNSCPNRLLIGLANQSQLPGEPSGHPGLCVCFINSWKCNCM